MTLADKNMQNPLHCPLIYYLFVQNDDSHVFWAHSKKLQNIGLFLVYLFHLSQFDYLQFYYL